MLWKTPSDGEMFEKTFSIGVAAPFIELPSHDQQSTDALLF